MSVTKITNRRLLAILRWATGSTTQSIATYYRRREWSMEDPEAFIKYMQFYLHKPNNRVSVIIGEVAQT